MQWKGQAIKVKDFQDGIHGQRRMWAVMGLDELAALNITLGRLL